MTQQIQIAVELVADLGQTRVTLGDIFEYEKVGDIILAGT